VWHVPIWDAIRQGTPENLSNWNAPVPQFEMGLVAHTMNGASDRRSAGWDGLSGIGPSPRTSSLTWELHRVTETRGPAHPSRLRKKQRFRGSSLNSPYAGLGR
jgi:hypothetical protein